LIIVSERAPHGRLLYMAIDGVRVTETNIRGLARIL
jgi:hypothetical protein